jgi:hypothetical protein
VSSLLELPATPGDITASKAIIAMTTATAKTPVAIICDLLLSRVKPFSF